MVSFLFYFFITILLVSASMVITTQNSVYSTLYLVLSFFAASSVLFLLECEFLGLLFIVVYVGAIAVLFLFVVMMLDVKTVSGVKSTVKYHPFAYLIGMVFFAEIVFVMFDFFGIGSGAPFVYRKDFYTNDVDYVDWYSKLDTLTDIEVLGQVLYTHYVLQFLIAGLILFLAVIGAVLFSIKFSSTPQKNMFLQELGKQHTRKVLGLVRFS